MSSRIIVYHPYNSKLCGNVFYLEEIAQYLQTKFDNVYVINSSIIDRNCLLSRYTKLTPEVYSFEKDDCVICSYYAIDELIKYINNLTKIFVICSADTHLMLKSRYMLKLLFNNKKFYLCYQPGFETEALNLNTFKNRILSIVRGFYFENYVSKHSKYINNEKYLIYSNKLNNINKYKYYTKDTYKKCIEYCIGNNIKYDEIDDKFISYNPAAEYMGLLYIRFKDYMPRLPYEFWYYNKPVIFLDISDGLKNMNINIKPDIPIINNDCLKLNRLNINLDSVVKEII